MSLRNVSGLLLVLAFGFAGCSSSNVKQRKEARDRLVQSAHLYCDFINGEVYSDIEVALNIEMAKRCDPDKNMSITQYRTPSENQGIVFCCSMIPSKAGQANKADKSKKMDELSDPEAAAADTGDAKPGTPAKKK